MSAPTMICPRRSPRGLSAILPSLLLLVLALLGATAAAVPPKMCIPDTWGVPGSSGPPDWWTPGQTTGGGNPFNLAYQPFDPRWRGAMSLDYGSGSISQVDFRGLYQDVAGTKYLLLSWRMKSVPQPSLDHTALYVGFYNPVVAGGQGALLTVTLRDSTGADPNFPVGTPVARKFGEVNPATTKTYFDATLTTGTGADPGAWVTQATPAWFTDNLRVWANADTNPYNWTVQLRVPVAAAIANGLNLPDTSFKMWNYVQEGALLKSNMPPAIVPYTWPRPDAGLSVLTYATYNSPTGQVYPAADAALTPWGDFALAGHPEADATCNGVYLASDHIGTRATLYDSEIKLNGVNTFFAEPENKTSAAILINTLGATFRFANWGSQVGDVTAASWTAPTALQKVLAGALPPPDAANSALAGGFAKIEGQWNLSTLDEDICPFIGKSGIPATATAPAVPGRASCLNPNPVRMLHQCMLVDLSGPGLNFVRGSAVRNMNFVKASRFEREAEISVVGLPDLAAGQRDVFLYAERRNMPRTVPVGDTGGTTEGNPDQPGLRDGPRVTPLTVTETTAPSKLPSDEELANGMPTWITHAYHDSGEKIRLAGQDYRVLVPQTSFGYFVSHEGSLQGWSDLIQGAERLREDIYRVAPPNNGAVRVTTIVQAVEPGETPVGQPWPPAERPVDFLKRWWWLILLLVLVALVTIWRRSGP